MVIYLNSYRMPFYSQAVFARFENSKFFAQSISGALYSGAKVLEFLTIFT